MKFIQIFLLVLIIIGIGLLVTRDMWVPPLVLKIIEAYPAKNITVAPAVSDTKKSFQYNYDCDEHVSMALSFEPDMSALHIKSTGGGTFPKATTLVRKDIATGTRYEGGNIVLTAHGETVTLGEGDSAINCSPVEVPDEAPFNFGD